MKNGKRHTEHSIASLWTCTLPFALYSMLHILCICIVSLTFVLFAMIWRCWWWCLYGDWWKQQSSISVTKTHDIWIGVNENCAVRWSQRKKKNYNVVVVGYKWREREWTEWMLYHVLSYSCHTMLSCVFIISQISRLDLIIKLEKNAALSFPGISYLHDRMRKTETKNEKLKKK